MQTEAIAHQEFHDWESKLVHLLLLFYRFKKAFESEPTLQSGINYAVLLLAAGHQFESSFELRKVGNYSLIFYMEIHKLEPILYKEKESLLDILLLSISSDFLKNFFYYISLFSVSNYGAESWYRDLNQILVYFTCYKKHPG